MNRSNMSIDPEEVLLREYVVCNDKAHSYMAVCWQIGAIFISASILMLGISVQMFPKAIGVLLIPIFWITLLAWYKIFTRINWVCHRAYDRAKAIEKFLKDKHKGIGSLKYGDKETAPINSWIDSLDKTLKTSQLGTKYIQIILLLLGIISLLILKFYIIFFICW